MKREPTFIFEANRVYAMLDDAVVASADSIEELEEKLAATPPYEPQQGDPTQQDYSPDNEVEMPEPPQDVQDQLGLDNNCPQCNHPCDPEDKFCAACGSDLHGAQGAEPPVGDSAGDMQTSYPQDRPQDAGLPYPQGSMKVVTPNGLEGTVLGRVQGTWGEEVTVRFANGRIVSLPVSDGMEFTASSGDKVVVDPVESLTERLAASVDGTRPSLNARLTELDSIIKAARSGDVTPELDSIIAQARAEKIEVKQAIAHLDDETTQAYAPPAPFKMQAVEQESFGGGSGNWLDQTVNDMIAEAESTDYEKLMDEGPEAFVAELPVQALAHAGTVRHAASEFIQSKTAGADDDVRERYHNVWLARVEEVRKGALAEVKDESRKEAASEVDHSSLPDDSLFL